MSRPTILIADDCPFEVKLLTAVFAADYDIIVAPDGARALELAVRHLPDLVLLDAMMPVVDGYEACRQLKAEERTKGIPVIFITGLDNIEDELRALQLGAIDFISKPIKPGVVGLRVRNHMELKRYRDFLVDLSLVDGLTGIGNRRCFDEFLAREARRARRENAPLSLIVADVDFFKRYNDHYGHAGGDECLRQVARAIDGIVRRPGDLAARIGGEEFAVILSNTDLAGAHILGERIRACVEALALPHAGSEAADCITISVGVASGRLSDEISAFSLMAQADSRLYEAKRGGRNRVI